MAWRTPLSTTATGPAVTLGAGRDLYVAQGVALISSNAAGVAMSPGEHRVVVDGSVAGRTAGILGLDVDGSRFDVGEGARVVGLEGAAMRLSGTDLSLRIEGLVQSYARDDDLGALMLGMPGGPATATRATVEMIAGKIVSGEGWGVVVGSGATAFRLVLDDDSLIRGGEGAIRSEGTRGDRIENGGALHGDVSLGAGNDRFDSVNGWLVGSVLGGGGEDLILGSSNDDALFGGSGNDTLGGSWGADRFVGGTGTDFVTYRSDPSGSVLVDLADPTVNQSTAAGDTYAGIEGVIGSDFDDELRGAAGAETLRGGAGNDEIAGRAGNDRLTGGAGADQFVFAHTGAANRDTITDFEAGVDDIILLQMGFQFIALPVGPQDGQFLASTAGVALSAFDQLLYETDTGILRYDADGNGAGAAVVVAQLQVNLALTGQDFLVLPG